MDSLYVNLLFWFVNNLGPMDSVSLLFYKTLGINKVGFNERLNDIDSFYNFIYTNWLIDFSSSNRDSWCNGILKHTFIGDFSFIWLWGRRLILEMIFTNTNSFRYLREGEEVRDNINIFPIKKGKISQLIYYGKPFNHPESFMDKPFLSDINLRFIEESACIL